MRGDPCLNEHKWPCDIRCLCGVTDQAFDDDVYKPHNQISDRWYPR